jgi:hypothetical protein
MTIDVTPAHESRQFLFLLASTRKNGNTKLLEHFSNTRAVFSCVQGGFFLRKKPLGILLSLYTNWKNALARTAAQGILSQTNQRWLYLADFPLPPFRDIRHEGDGIYPDPVGNERALLEASLSATDLVIASPLYWCTVSAEAKLYLDYWSAWLRVPSADFKRRMSQKTLWAITAMSGEDTTQADMLSGFLRRCVDYLGMRWGGTLIGHGNRPGDVLVDTNALSLAKSFFLNVEGNQNSSRFRRNLVVAGPK